MPFLIVEALVPVKYLRMCVHLKSVKGAALISAFSLAS